ncbi:hypothetical protein [Mesoplasma photuris]|uniref:hypothetical protein n=1 Tax=Mesoplasma photuris TaxID=217731 RepID=UPI0004E23864|nr:hypothetical protein [Mesoplasma photuris]
MKENKKTDLSFWNKLNNLSKKTRIISAAVLMSVPMALGAGLLIPGMGIESLRFIGTVKKVIEKEIPEGKYVIDTDVLGGASKMIVRNSLKSSYLADARSATNFYTEEGSEENLAKYEEYTNTWFENRWGDIIDQGQDIDLYDVSMDLIEFDESFAQEFHEFGYVNPGITWIFQPKTLQRLFDVNLTKTDWYQTVVEKQTILDQDTYDGMVEYTGPSVGGITVHHSAGAYLLNNKVWFLNVQRENIRFLLSTAPFLFTDKTLTPDDIPAETKPEDLRAPDFVKGIRMTQTAVSLLFIIGPVILAIGGFYIYKTKKEEN